MSSFPRTVRLALGGFAVLLGLTLMLGWQLSRPGSGELRSLIYNKPTVMTVAYKAYGNPEAANGKYWFAKVVLENTGKGPLRDVKVSYQIPEYIPWTTPDQAPELLPGQTAVFVWYPKFPASVTRIRSRTPASLEVKFEYNDGQPQSRIEKREFALRGVTEFEFTSLPASEIVNYYDLYDNQELAAAYVTDEDPVIKTYYAKISEVSGGINMMSNQRDLVQLAKSTYDFMVSTGMTYSGAKGVPESVGDSKSFVQSMRLPRDVVYGNSGLCVELAYLWASIAQAAGAKPYLVFIPGHAFVILEAGDGSQLPVECTMIGGGAGGNLNAAGTFDQAVEAAGKTLQQVMEAGAPITILNVQEQHANGIRPPELEEVNRPELAKFLDDLRARHGGAAGQQVAMNDPRGGGNGPVPAPNQAPSPNPNPNPNPAPVPPPNQDPGTDPNPVPAPNPVDPNPVPPPVPAPNPNPGPNPVPGPGPQPANMKTWSDARNRISLAYPNSWALNDQTVQALKQYLPGYVFSSSDPQTFAGVDVVFFDNMDLQTAAQTLLNFFQQMGAQPQTGEAKMIKISGHDAMTIPITLSGQAGSINGAMTFISINGGVVDISVGAPAQVANQAAEIFGQILGSVRING